MTARAAPSRTALVGRTRRINRELARLYPDARLELNFSSPLELLVAAVLAAQSTDHRANEVTPVLFARYPTACDYAAADRAELDSTSAGAGSARRAGRAPRPAKWGTPSPARLSRYRPTPLLGGGR